MKTYAAFHHGHNRQSPKKGEIWMADSLPFCDGVNSKDRPVLIISRKDRAYKCYKCTSQHSDFRKRYEIQDLEEAGLFHRTFIDYDVVLIPIDKLTYKMGKLSENDVEHFENGLI